jgi:hypothetical protein
VGGCFFGCSFEADPAAVDRLGKAYAPDWFGEFGGSLLCGEDLRFEALVLPADPDGFFVGVAGFFQLGPELFLTLLLGGYRLAAPVLIHHYFDQTFRNSVSRWLQGSVGQSGQYNRCFSVCHWRRVWTLSAMVRWNALMFLLPIHKFSDIGGQFLQHVLGEAVELRGDLKVIRHFDHMG